MERPIGVIDSGVGGLTVLHELKRQLPKEKFIYLGDTLRCPYGSKEEDEVIHYTWEMVRYLLKFDIKMLIIACNTATALVLEQLKQSLPIPVIGVIEPGARAAIKATRTNHVAIIGTDNTIRSEAYEQTLRRINPNVETTSIACPKFVPMIESGDFSPEEARSIVSESLNTIKQYPTIDALILGCTHYPIIENLIKEYVGKHVSVLSSATETGFEVSTVLTLCDMHYSGENEENEPLILTTGSLHVFQRLTEEIFQTKSASLKQITLSQTQ